MCVCVCLRDWVGLDGVGGTQVLAEGNGYRGNANESQDVIYL